MLTAFKKHFANTFVPSWIACLDESMSIWNSRWTCPGWVFCPRKPHPQGNEYHTICCGETGILFDFEVVEGRDRPTQLGRPEYEVEHGKTGGLLLRLTKSIHQSARYVVLDSGFCVLKGLISLVKSGVFACSLIKKRRYWPAYCQGETIDQYFVGKNIGDTAAVEGELDGVPYNIWCFKEPDYVCKMFGTAGGLNPGSGREHSRVWTEDGVSKSATFKYAEPFTLHFKYRHAVDDHNNLRHQVPSIEETWTTICWACRVFSFLLAVTEVNVYLTMRHFVWDDTSQITLVAFRQALAWQLVTNNLSHANDPELRRSKRRRNLGVLHDLETAPKHAKYHDGKKWVTEAKTKYPQYTCSHPRCDTRTRTYCVCNPNNWLCKDHWKIHFGKVLLKE